MSEIAIPHVKKKIQLIYHSKIQKIFRTPFWKTSKIKNNICFSCNFKVSKGPLLNAKDYFSLAPSVSELLGFFSLIFYFEMDSSNHDNTLINLKLITERNGEVTFFGSEIIYIYEWVGTLLYDCFFTVFSSQLQFLWTDFKIFFCFLS